MIGLYLEHLEEASFLYEQRLALHDDPEVTWLDVGDFEARLEAHLDALVLGEALAVDVCRQQATEGDFGELYAALCVFCRHDRWDLVEAHLDALEAGDDARVQAAADALCHEAPAAWEPRFVAMLSRHTAPHNSIAARLAGWRRLAVAGAPLLALLKAPAPDVLPAAVWALGRLGYQPARGPLYERALQHEDEAIRAAAALALLRLGEPQTVQFCSIFARTQPWTHVPLGLGGSRSDAEGLRALAAEATSGPDSLLALGLLGDPAAVEVLLYQLGEAPLAEAAALALHLITGAALYEEVFIPEEPDEDELFEDEREKLRRGEPLTPDEQPPATTAARLSQNPDVWRAWWAQNHARFQPGVRYRAGRPYAPAVLRDVLTQDTALHQPRRWAYEELVIRYGMPVSFEADLPVARQQPALAQIDAWIAAHGSAFREGKWYFAGTPITW